MITKDGAYATNNNYFPAKSYLFDKNSTYTVK